MGEERTPTHRSPKVEEIRTLNLTTVNFFRQPDKGLCWLFLALLHIVFQLPFSLSPKLFFPSFSNNSAVSFDDLASSLRRFSGESFSPGSTLPVV